MLALRALISVNVHIQSITLVDPPKAGLDFALVEHRRMFQFRTSVDSKQCQFNTKEEWWPRPAPKERWYDKRHCGTLRTSCADGLPGTDKTTLLSDFLTQLEAEDTTLPLTGKGVVSKIITDLAVFEVTKDRLILTEHAPDVTVEQIREQTTVPFMIILKQ